MTRVVFGGKTMENLAEKISDSDLEIMEVLWDAEDALPITEIRIRVQRRVDWKDTTVKTLVQRLCDKGVVGQEKRKIFFYFPKIGRKEYQNWATGNLVRKLYKGSAKNLVAALVNSEGLSSQDLEELRAMFKVEE